MAERSESEEGHRWVRRRSTGFGGGGGGSTEEGFEGGAGERAAIKSETWLAVNGSPGDGVASAASAAGAASGAVPARVAIRSPDARLSTPALAAWRLFYFCQPMFWPDDQGPTILTEDVQVWADFLSLVDLSLHF